MKIQTTLMFLQNIPEWANPVQSAICPKNILSNSYLAKTYLLHHLMNQCIGSETWQWQINVKVIMQHEILGRICFCNSIFIIGQHCVPLRDEQKNKIYSEKSLGLQTEELPRVNVRFKKKALHWNLCLVPLGWQLPSTLATTGNFSSNCRRLQITQIHKSTQMLSPSRGKGKRGGKCVLYETNYVTYAALCMQYRGAEKHKLEANQWWFTAQSIVWQWQAEQPLWCRVHEHPSFAAYEGMATSSWRSCSLASSFWCPL